MRLRKICLTYVHDFFIQQGLLRIIENTFTIYLPESKKNVENIKNKYSNMPPK